VDELVNSGGKSDACAYAVLKDSSFPKYDK
jgi:predicted DNA-binding transcriptional regulator AlpA